MKNIIKEIRYALNMEKDQFNKEVLKNKNLSYFYQIESRETMSDKIFDKIKFHLLDIWVDVEFLKWLEEWIISQELRREIKIQKLKTEIKDLK